ncbi:MULTISPECIES: DUF429 domain-containing protein [unclassified Nitrospina]|uniref:DUF429 domain-containing protein n=1 Tax=unclassified Nitrospina TaxID=2638683 RepID=UPI003F95AB27
MKIFGVDFTSSPTRRKPITLAVSELKGDALIVTSVESLTTFNDFEYFLKQAEPSFTGMDFPFGLPHAFVLDQGWSPKWLDYVDVVSRMPYETFSTRILEYKKKKPEGFKDPLRFTDFLAGSQSPLKLINTPVAKMFYEGAPRILSCGATIPPVFQKSSKRVILEAYPGFLARQFVNSYKTESKGSDTGERKKARKIIVEKIQDRKAMLDYGFRVQMNDDMCDSLIQNYTGDRLDAVLCAIQAAWAGRQGKPRFGIKTGNRTVIQSEGWIADPSL